MRPQWELAGESGMRVYLYTLFTAFFISLISIAMSIVSWFKIKKYKLEGKGFAIVGAWISLLFYPIMFFLESYKLL